jgi:hypothetical protein
MLQNLWHQREHKPRRQLRHVYCPAALSILLASLTPLSPLA